MMSLLRTVKCLSLLILIGAIAVSIRYESTNSKYLFVRCLHSLFSIKYSVISDPIRPELSADYRAFEHLLKFNSKFQLDPLKDPLVIVKDIRSSISFADLIPKSKDCRIEKEILEYNGQKNVLEKARNVRNLTAFFLETFLQLGTSRDIR